MRNRVLLCAACTGVLVPAGLAVSAPLIPTVLMSNIQASPTSDVPGLPGVKWKPGTSTSIAFDRPFVSPDGNRWAIAGFVDAPIAEDDVIVTGFGSTTAGGQTIARAGTPTPFDPNLNYNVINTHLTINNAGQVAFSGNANVTGNQYVALYDGVTVQRIVAQGTPSPVPGLNWTATLNAANVTGDARVGFQGTATPTPTQYLTILDGNILSQTGMTVPTGQLVAPDQANNILTSNSFRVSDDGTRFMYRTTLQGPTASNAVVVLNNQVLAQLGAPVPGWAANTANVSSIASEAGGVHLSRSGGHWAFRGAVNDGTGATNQTDFVLVNGAVVAATDQPIFAGATELFDDTLFGQTFFVNTTNNLGDYVIGGTTNNPDTTRDAVLVFNNEFVVLRESDPVDLSGNGMFDDDVFINVFGNDDTVLTDDLRLFVNANLKNSAGTLVGQAIIMVQVPEPATLSLLSLAGLALVRRRR